MGTRMDYSHGVLLGLGIKPNWRHVGARRAIVAWSGEEDGWFEKLDGVDGAKYNLLNTTLALTGCTAPVNYNSVPVRNYLSFACGVKATVATLLEPRYAGLVNILATPGVFGKTVLHAVADSDWGSFKTAQGTPDYAGADAIYDTYIANRGVYNAVVVGPQ